MAGIALVLPGGSAILQERGDVGHYNSYMPLCFSDLAYPLDGARDGDSTVYFFLGSVR